MISQFKNSCQIKMWPVFQPKEMIANPSTDYELARFAERSLQISEFGSKSSNNDHHDKASSIKMEKKIQGDTSNIRSKKLQLNDENISNAAPVSIGDYNERNKCIICRKKPKEVGFLHKDFIHFCVCSNCALRITLETGRCPVCNIPVEQTINVM